MSDVKSELGRIWTFYSYKGGTGRSMLLANLAWLLANHGKRVLVIDWDLEAPGLHRYYRPFLDDPELTDTPGLIDHFTEFIEFARIRASQPSPPSEDANARPWHEPWIRLERNAVALDHSFENGGVLEFIGAGRQSASYAARVSEFNWNEFYDKAGGGILLEAIKQQLRLEYDYILIDSRTGLSDTAGICTVQMPDELMVCFTLNRQSIFGAAATAESAARQRRKPTGEPGLRIWPIASRVEWSEKERLDRARVMARDCFANQPWHLTRQQREVYWSRAEVPYFPYYAYEEILAAIADRSGQRNTLLECVDVVLGEITNAAFPRLLPSTDRKSEADRHRLFAKYGERYYGISRPLNNGASNPTIFIRYSRTESVEYIQNLYSVLSREIPTIRVVVPDTENVKILTTATDVRLAEAQVVVVVLGRKSIVDSEFQYEIREALLYGKQIVSVFVDGITSTEIIEHLGNVGIGLILKDGVYVNANFWPEDVTKLVLAVKRSLEVLQPIHYWDSTLNREDLQKGQWGGKPESNGRRLTADIKALSETWYRIVLTVQSKDGSSLEKDVNFHLHPTFGSRINCVKPVDGKATLEIHAWGAFTVGAETDDGKTRLELDLAELESAPKSFRER